MTHSPHPPSAAGRGACERALRWALWPAFVSVFLAACDSSPSGGVSYTVTVEWTEAVEPLGGALVFLGAPGLGTASAVGDALLWQNTPPGEEGGLRVLLIDTGEASALQFIVPADALPSATLLGLVTQENDPLVPPLEGYSVRVSRTP